MWKSSIMQTSHWMLLSIHPSDSYNLQFQTSPANVYLFFDCNVTPFGCFVRLLLFVFFRSTFGQKLETSPSAGNWMILMCIYFLLDRILHVYNVCIAQPKADLFSEHFISKRKGKTSSISNTNPSGSVCLVWRVFQYFDEINMNVQHFQV